MFVLRNSAELVSMFARKHFLSNLHSPNSEMKFQCACSRQQPARSLAMVLSENIPKSDSENVNAARVKFSRKILR